MSRVPKPISTRPKPRETLKSPSKSGSRLQAGSSSGISSPASARAKTPTRPSAKIGTVDEASSTKPPISIKDAIALKRAEAKKAQSSRANSDSLHSSSTLEDPLPVPSKKEEEEVFDLGRLSIKETIERARSTGSLNLSTRSLVMLPSALFEIHLGVKPDPLKSVPIEPPLPASSENTTRRGGKREMPAWFEAQDLQTLKAWGNDISEIQNEISLFGSLKVVDLHKNRLSQLPDHFADLTALTILDLSHNALISLPVNLFALPNLTTINLSHNLLTCLPFGAPFATSDFKSNYPDNVNLFTPAIVRASAPLPRLLTLDASHNQISASGIDYTNLPPLVSNIELSCNPIGPDAQSVRALIQAFGRLERLKELHLEKAEIGDDAFPFDLIPSASFPNLRILDLGETKVTTAAASAALRGLKQELAFHVTPQEPPEGTLRVIVGKKVIREAWEIEAEKKTQLRSIRNHSPDGMDDSTSKGALSPDVRSTGQERTVMAHVKEPWEIEAEQGLFTEGAKRRARAAAAAAESSAPSQSEPKTDSRNVRKEVLKEAWEIEAEQGLLTEGGRRRARAAAAAAAANTDASVSNLGKGAAPPPLIGAQSLTVFSLANPQFYNKTSQTLTLPPSTSASKPRGHGRAFSLASPTSLSASGTPPRASDIAVPSPTLPLATICKESFAQNLKVLILTNRRMDKSCSLPSQSSPLPNLEELSLEGCEIGDSLTVARESPDSGAGTPQRSTEALLPLITRIFPSLRTLDLSFNSISSSSLSTENLSSLILASPDQSDAQVGRKGLRHLRLRGNQITELEGLIGVADLFKGNRNVPNWKLEELDLRDNEIAKLPPELGLLPLDVFLVDGNVFRVPQRRVWEREGTKGLLSWLRGRIE